MVAPDIDRRGLHGDVWARCSLAFPHHSYRGLEGRLQPESRARGHACLARGGWISIFPSFYDRTIAADMVQPDSKPIAIPSLCAVKCWCFARGAQLSLFG